MPLLVVWMGGAGVSLRCWFHGLARILSKVENLEFGLMVCLMLTLP